ncbi:Ionotropic receptor 191 [Frankliniella occidentalis]|nr:Ionotropic receptor 191 [Frankliniella occidentalis]
MEALLVAFLLCCVAPGVRAGLPVVDSAAPPEARSAAALLTPFMAPQKANLVVRGTSRWTGAFLRELSADIPRVLGPRPSHLPSAWRHDNTPDTLHIDRLEHGLIATRLVHFVPTDDLQELLYAMKNYPVINKVKDIRVLFWTTLLTVSAHQARVLRQIFRLNTWLGGRQHALALTSFNGSTTLYNLTCTPSDACLRMDASVFEMDRWSPVQQHWRLRANPFYEFCSSHRSMDKHQDLTVYLDTRTGLTNTSSLMELTKVAVNLVSRGRNRRIGWQKSVNYQRTGTSHSIILALKECTLGAFLSDEEFFTRDDTSDFTFLLDMKMAGFVVIVPAGYGASVGVLDAVTVEFSPTLWLATGLATLCTVVVLKYTRRQDVSSAVLQALAPMLGQAPPPPAPPRPMLAAWLLACVVLTAAYQGLLLGKLSSAVPRRDLDSLQDLEDSGLPVKAREYLVYSDMLTDNLNARTEHIPFSEIKTVINTIATARNCALVTVNNRHTYSYMRPYMVPKKLHAIRLSYSQVEILAVTTKGSPLEGPLATAQGRVEAAGLLARWRRAEYEREYQDDAKRLVSLRGPKSMTLWHLQPAFVVLGAGNMAGVVAFALEAMWAWRARWAGRKESWVEVS